MKEHCCVNIFHTFSPLHRSILTFLDGQTRIGYEAGHYLELAVGSAISCRLEECPIP
jgi:hypothetical protein